MFQNKGQEEKELDHPFSMENALKGMFCGSRLQVFKRNKKGSNKTLDRIKEDTSKKKEMKL